MGNPLANLGTYDLRHLAAHLHAAGRADDLHRLLALETGEQRNAWYEAKEAIDDAAGFAADVGLAWRSAENAYANGAHTGQSLGLQIRYALITSSLNSLAQSIPPAMIGALVKQEIWSMDRAMTYVRRIVDVEQRADAMAELLPLLDTSQREEWFSEALVSARAIRFQPDYTSKLLKLVNNLPDPKPQSVLRSFFAEIMGLSDANSQVQVLLEMADYLPDDLVPKALSLVKSDWKNLRFAHRLDEPERGEMITETLSAARETGDAFVLALALSQLKKHLWSPEYEPLLHEGLIAARSKEEGLKKAYALMLLVPLLSGNEQEQALRELLSVLEYLHAQDRIFPLEEIAPELPAALRKELLVAARRIDDEYNRIKALATLAPSLAGEQQESLLKEILAAANRWEDVTFSHELERLVPLMSPSLLREALTAVRNSSKMSWRARALAVLGRATSLPGPEREDSLRAALKAIEALRQAGEISHAHQALQTLSPYLPLPLLKEALSALQTIGDGLSLIENLELLFPHLPEAEKMQAWHTIVTATAGRETEWRRAGKVAQLAQHLPGSLYAEVITLAQQLEEPQIRAIALAGLAPRLSPGEREPILAEALTGAESTDDPWARAKALIAVLQVLPLSERQRIAQEVLAAPYDMGDGRLRARILVQLIPFLSETQREHVLLQEIETAGLAPSEGKGIVSTLAPVLPESLVYKILYGSGHSLLQADLESFIEALDQPERERRATEMRQRISESKRYGAFAGYQHEVFPALIARLAELGGIEEAYRALGDLDQNNRAATLASLAAYLPASVVRVEWQATLQMTPVHEREHALAALSARIAELGDWKEALYQARRIEDRQWRARALQGISVHLEGETQEQVLQESWNLMQQIDNYLHRKDLIVELVPHLVKLPPAILHRLCPQLLVSLSRHTRQEQIPELYILTPVFVAAGGMEAVLAFYHAFQEVRRWWP